MNFYAIFNNDIHLSFLFVIISWIGFGLTIVGTTSSNTTVHAKQQCLPYNCKTVPCNVAPDIMCYTAFNVNLNKTVQLANPLSYPNTTLDPSGCHLDLATQGQNTLKELRQNPTMYASDAKALGPIDSFMWCGIEK